MYNYGIVPSVRDEIKLLNDLKFHIGKSNNTLGPNDVVEPPHIHTELEIILNVSSDISFLVDGNLYPLNRGDIIISKPNEVHVCVYNKCKAQGMYILWIDEKDNLELFKDFYQAEFSPKVTFEEDDKNLILSLFGKLNDLYLKKDVEIEKAYLFLSILRLIKNGNKKGASKKDIPSEFKRILDYINDNYSNINSVNDVVNANYISYSTLNRFFSAYLNVSPKEYLDSVKLSNAVKLLDQNASVTETCFKSGFSDCSRFITIFKNRFGVTPFNYKKKKEPKF